MQLLIIFAALSLSFAGLLFVVSLVVQGYLYSQPANRLPLRALTGGVLAAAFLTFWVHINTRADTKDKYGTLFEFNSTASKPFDEFVAVRRLTTKNAEGKPNESKVKFNKVNGAYIEGKDPAKPFKLTSSGGMVVAIEIPDGEATVRYEAELFVPDEAKPGELRPYKPGDAAEPTFSRGAVRTFRETNGRRFIEFTQGGSPGTIQVPSRGAFLGALLLNVLHFAVWVVVFWPILHYTSGAAIGLATGMTVMVMLFAMPIMFDRVKPATASVPAMRLEA